MKRTKYYFSIFSTLFLLLSCKNYAQEQNKSIFWEISGNGLENPSYLFGTIHVIPQEEFSLPDSLPGYFKSCKRIVMEIKMDSPDFLAITLKSMAMEDSSLTDFLRAEDYVVIEKFFKDSLNMNLAQLKKIKPLFLVSFLYPKMLGKQLASYETTFTLMAKENKQEIIGLETVEEQIAAVDKIPIKNQANMLLESINEFEESKKTFQDLIIAYKNKDLSSIYKLMLESSKETKEFEEILLNERNNKWIPRIEKIIKQQSCFIAVGALHLEGSNGLVEQLRKIGYTLRPL